MQLSNIGKTNFEYKDYMIEINTEFYGVDQCSGIVEMSIIFEAKHKTEDKEILESESLKEILEKIDDTYKLNNELETKIENKKEIYNKVNEGRSLRNIANDYNLSSSSVTRYYNDYTSNNLSLNET